VTLANRVTTGRLVLSIVYFGLLAAWSPTGGGALMAAALGLFAVICFTDWLDGYLARTRGEETDFGRIADPFVDKVAVCGSLVFFLKIDLLEGIVAAWMVVVVVAREFVVHGVRAVAEARGIKFGANLWGKLKMILQCAAVLAALLHCAGLHRLEFYAIFLQATMWLMLFSTVWSGAIYLVDARRVLMERGV
jgi:CDP-diacylglycerol--glycerol-3-phosphate 3-phosphatidyltransferase